MDGDIKLAKPLRLSDNFVLEESENEKVWKQMD
jgi:hypothetical protein